ncbi:MAG: shikimate dehydrogenase family protein, partial [Ktedonobacterales bacterium]
MAKGMVRYVGLIGHPVGFSRSPAMQQAAFDALGITARYELWDTPPKKLAERVAALRAPEMLGANVTIPHKSAVVPLLDSVAAETLRHVGVVNTIVREETPLGVRLVGHNTDFLALRRVLREHDAWTGSRRMLVLGAGGAAQAALGVAALEDAEVWVAARHPKAARAALEMLWQREHGTKAGATFPEEWHARGLDLADEAALARVLPEVSVLVNATPVGMGEPEAIPLHARLLRLLPASALVFDTVYNPPETALVRAARSAGRRASGGMAMLLYQGAEAFT